MTAPKPWFWKALFLLFLGFIGLNRLWIWRLKQPRSDIVGVAPRSMPGWVEGPIHGKEEKKLEQRFKWLRIGGQDPFHLEVAASQISSPPTEPMGEAKPEEATFSPNLILTATILLPGGKGKAILKSGAQEQIVQEGEKIQGMVLEKVTRSHVVVSKGSQNARIELFARKEGAAKTGGPPRSDPRMISRGPVVQPQIAQREGVVEEDDQDSTGFAESGPGINPALLRTIRHRPPEDWSGLRLRMNYFTPDKGEVKVISVSRTSPAYDAGIRPGDTIQSINGVAPPGLDEAFAMLNNTSVGSTVTIAIERGGFSALLNMDRPHP